jgi:O-methyltransferase
MATRKRDGALFGLTKGEVIDAVSASRFGRALEPLSHLVRRGGAISLGHEATRVLTMAFNYARSEGIEGDYAEFGVWTGRTFVEAWRIGNSLDAKRRYFAYDSFQGLPEAEGLDAGDRFKPGEFSHSRRAFEARLRRARVPAGEVEIVEGFSDDSLDAGAAEPRSVAIAWVDCDLYASTVPVLGFLTERLAQGSILLFDDWFCFAGDASKGEARACAEWLERNPQIKLVPWRQFNWAGQAFIVRRGDTAATPDES